MPHLHRFKLFTQFLLLQMLKIAKKKKKGVDKRGKIWYDKKALERGERKRPARGAEVFEN